ncbi:hypothetical protein HPB48_013392 [Haemaphysalis longicornis]|uniref:TGF-beta propeptide domain-containing protein n=1 Tax=Haemaphysalis longicornis TaxID=44386 RepID=A0A9J6G684_HAELO|nr:hypothetical protein HPB48_013392 [Haemaphysalis longicornis]
MAGGALQAVLAAALLLAGCGGRCTAGAGDRGLAGGDQRQIKLDAVRHQILSKLSLRERPPQRREPASPLARELALEALRRVHLLPEPRALEDQGAPDPRQAQDDDYYGRTAEIIAFAEPGERFSFLLLPLAGFRNSLSRCAHLPQSSTGPGSKTIVAKVSNGLARRVVNSSGRAECPHLGSSFARRRKETRYKNTCVKVCGAAAPAMRSPGQKPSRIRNVRRT